MSREECSITKDKCTRRFPPPDVDVYPCDDCQIERMKLLFWANHKCFDFSSKPFEYYKEQGIKYFGSKCFYRTGGIEYPKDKDGTIDTYLDDTTEEYYNDVTNDPLFFITSHYVYAYKESIKKWNLLMEEMHQEVSQKGLKENE